jgi:hypothetical protein
MKALAMLRRPFHVRARSAVVPPSLVAIRSEVVDFVDAVVRGLSDVAVVDPTLAELNREVPNSLSRMHLGTVLYIRLTPEYAQAAVGMIRELGSGEIVTYGYTDDPMTFAGILRRQSRANRHQYLLRALEPQISLLPPELRAGIEAMSEQGDRIDSVDSLASVCGVTRGTLWRQLRNAGISSAWGFVAGLSLLRNYDALVGKGLKILDVAHAVGLSSERALQRRCVVVSGLTLRAIREPVSIQELAQRIAVILTTPAHLATRPQQPAQPTQPRHVREAVRARDYSV